MREAATYTLSVIVIGSGATAAMDLWMIARKRLLGVPSLDYGLVGRWIAHLARGRFRHNPIAASPPVRGECALGWAAHYLIGVVFAALLVAVWGLDWVRRPTPGPALVVGFGTAAAPFLLMQPSMGFGIAASRTPRPASARVNTLITHGIFGLGMYATGWIASLLLSTQ